MISTHQRVGILGSSVMQSHVDQYLPEIRTQSDEDKVYAGLAIEMVTVGHDRYALHVPEMRRFGF